MGNKECSECGKVTEVHETPSGFEVCKDCWKKYNVQGGIKGDPYKEDHFGVSQDVMENGN